MKMVDCSALETLVVNHERIELIDVRSKKEFAAIHIPGARSVPFGELAAARIFRRGRLMTEPVYAAVTLEPALRRGFYDRPVA